MKSSVSPGSSRTISIFNGDAAASGMASRAAGTWMAASSGIETCGRLAGPEHVIPDRRAHSEAAIGDAKVMRHVVPLERYQPSRPRPCRMDEIVQGVVRNISGQKARVEPLADPDTRCADEQRIERHRERERDGGGHDEATAIARVRVVNAMHEVRKDDSESTSRPPMEEEAMERVLRHRPQNDAGHGGRR